MGGKICFEMFFFFFSGYTGTKCEYGINVCASEPCIHGGTCQVRQMKAFFFLFSQDSWVSAFIHGEPRALLLISPSGLACTITSASVPVVSQVDNAMWRLMNAPPVPVWMVELAKIWLMASCAHALLVSQVWDSLVNPYNPCVACRVAYMQSGVIQFSCLCYLFQEPIVMSISMIAFPLHVRMEASALMEWTPIHVSVPPHLLVSGVKGSSCVLMVIHARIMGSAIQVLWPGRMLSSDASVWLDSLEDSVKWTSMTVLGATVDCMVIKRSSCGLHLCLVLFCAVRFWDDIHIYENRATKKLSMLWVGKFFD